MRSNAMSWVLVFLVSCSSLVSCSPAPDLSDETRATLVMDAPPARCGAPLPGPPLAPGIVEGDPSYPAVLGSTDASFLPDPLDLRAENGFTRAVVSHMLGRGNVAEVTHAEALARGGMGRAVLVAAARGTGGMLDPVLLRQGLHHHYQCTTPLPASLRELVARHGDYHAWFHFDVPCSRAKDGPRRIYEDGSRGVFVAETLAPDGAVRETEVIWSRLRPDGQLEFAVYTPEGDLTDRSTFATTSGQSVTLAAPFTCMTCHYDAAATAFTRRMPVGTGAGCAP